MKPAPTAGLYGTWQELLEKFVLFLERGGYWVGDARPVIFRSFGIPEWVMGTTQPSKRIEPNSCNKIFTKSLADAAKT